jgi:outer membrane protein
VRVSYFGVLYRKSLLDILMDRVLQREDELEDALALREVGMVTSLDVRQAQLLRNTALDELRAQEAEYEAALIEFNLALGRSGGGELLLPDGDLERPGGLQALLEAAKAALAEEQLLELRAARNDIQSSRHEKKLATGEFLPELVLVGTAESVKEGVFQEGESWTAGVQLRWSLFDGGLKRARRAAANANLKLAGETLSLEEKRLAGAVRLLEVRARTLDERISIQEEALELSEFNYQDARAHYRAGTITQTRLGEFSLAYAEARFGLKNLYFLERQLMAELKALLEGA